MPKCVCGHSKESHASGGVLKTTECCYQLCTLEEDGLVIYCPCLEYIESEGDPDAPTS